MPVRSFQVLRHRSCDSGREWRAERDKPLRRLLQPEARAEEGAEGKWQAVGDREASWQLALEMGFEHEIMEICAGIEIFAKKPAERSRGCNGSGCRVATSVTTH